MQQLRERLNAAFERMKEEQRILLVDIAEQCAAEQAQEKPRLRLLPGGAPDTPRRSLGSRSG